MPLGLFSKHWISWKPTLVVGTILLFLPQAACTNLPRPMVVSSEHLTLPEPSPLPEAPPLAEAAPLPPPPSTSTATERYSVVVNNVLAQEILFAVARDAKVNIEIHPNISGTVTMNLIDQTLTEILDAIARQVDMRYELNGRNLAIMPDIPYLKTYQIDYPNVTRNAENSISTSTSVAAIGQSGGSGGGSENGSSSSIKNVANNHFWETLIENLKDLLRETDKTMPEGSGVPAPERVAPTPASRQPVAASATETLGAQAQSQATAAPAPVTYREAAAVIANPESGTISVRATSRQQASVREFIDRVMVSARRQVLIEATIVEVALTDQYQQGIDWSILNIASGLNFKQVTPAGAITGVMGTIDYSAIHATASSTQDSTAAPVSQAAPLFETPPSVPNQTSATANTSVSSQGGRYDLTAGLKLLETFGKLHVLSSPKLSVLNNQTSLLKVVDESVYFTIDVTPGIAATATTAATAAIYTSNVHTLPVGFLMYVTPQIGSDAEVTLNLRPTISRITSYANDPNPVLKQNNISNLIPQIQTREMESILRVRNGEIAVLGGLMQDTSAGDTNQLPGVGDIPHLGELFKARNAKNSKSELVIFLRPVILDGDVQYDVSRLFKNSVGVSELQQNQHQEKAAP